MKQSPSNRFAELRRFLAIVDAIRADGYPNKTTLAEQLDCTPRLIQYYTEFLRKIGAPLEFDREHNGFYFSAEWHPTLRAKRRKP